MSNSVVVKDGRLIIQKDGKLVLDTGSDFIDACTNDKIIMALVKSGRVQELRMDGRFVKDIMASGAISIDLSADTLVITKTDGRQETYVNGRFTSSSGATQQSRLSGGRSSQATSSSGKSSPAVRATSKQSEAEKLGGAAADMLMREAGKFMTFALKKLREWFVRR